MTDFDIVAGLRSRSAWFKREDIAEVLENAANEIERLNDKVSFVCGDLALQEIARLRKERDGARRELCAARRELCRNEAIIRLQRHRVHRDSEDVVGLAKEIAVERGWDCFKDNPCPRTQT